MRVGEIGFAVRHSDGTYQYKYTRSKGDQPFPTWREANNRALRTAGAKVVPVILVTAEAGVLP